MCHDGIQEFGLQRFLVLQDMARNKAVIARIPDKSKNLRLDNNKQDNSDKKKKKWIKKITSKG